MFTADWQQLLAERFGAGNVEVVRSFRSVNDVLLDPTVLTGKTPAEVAAILGEPPGWQTETLGQGSRAGEGWVLREYLPNGQPSGRMIRWHPGGGHHGADPYWRVVSGEGGNSGVIPAVN